VSLALSQGALELTLPKAVTVDLVDRRLAELYDDADYMWETPLVIDLTAASFIDVTALLHILAVVAERKSAELETAIAIPESQKARDFLRAWDFPIAIAAATGQPFWRLVTDGSREYFGERQVYYTGRRRSVEPRRPESYQLLLRRRFFGFLTYALGRGRNAAAIVEDEWSRWQGPLVLGVLNRHLAGPGADVARVVIYELLANAIQHPSASQVTLVSRATGIDADDRRTDGQLTVSLWDDGTCIADTLRACTIAGDPIRISEPVVADVFAIKPVGWTTDHPIVPISWTPNAEASDEELLLASVFPGITQKAARQTQTIPALQPKQADMQSGYGLHALYKSVIDTFGGSVSMRSGALFMNLGRNTDRATRSMAGYRAKIVRMSGRPFPGNMITVRMPIKSDA
jgi:hypothetical protein